MDSLIERDVVYALAVRRLGNITRAAQQLGVQQAAVTRAVQRLEERLQKKLFLREPRGVRTSPFGQKFLSMAENHMHQWQNDLAELNDSEMALKGRVRFGAHLAIALTYIPRWLPKLTVEHPLIDVDVQLMPSVQVCHKVSSGELDMGLAISPLAMPRLVIKKLLIESVALYAQRDDCSNRILYNPEMIGMHKIIGKLKGRELYALPTYDLVACSLLGDARTVGLLPSSVASRYPELKAVSPVLRKYELSLVHREDLPKLRVNRLLINQCTSMLQS